jgi:iron complex outermembrane receptor protein
MSSSLHKGNDKGWSWNALGTVKYMGDKEAPDYVLSNSGNREANFSGDIKFTGKGCFCLLQLLQHYNWILSASHTGM